MSLQEAILLVADAMDKDSQDKDIPQAVLSAYMRAYARELRTAVASAKQERGVESATNFMVPEHQHRIMIDKAREEFRREKEKGEVQERHSSRMVEVGSGEFAGNMIEVGSTMPVGAKCHVNNKVYEL